MPKKPKTLPKKQPKTKQKVEEKTVNLASRKSYWVVLTIFMVFFGLFLGYTMNVSVSATGLMLGSVLAVIGFVFYLNFSSSPLKKSKRAMLIFAGLSIIGFLIWVAVVFLSDAAGFGPQITNSVGEGFFAITSLIICLLLGAFVGDLLGKVKWVQEQLGVFPEQKQKL